MIRHAQIQNMRQNRRQRRFRQRQFQQRGFTLVELLVVITIIGVLMGMLIPVIGRVREMAHRTACINNQSQIGVAMNLYATMMNHMPPTMNTASGLGWAQGMMSQLGRADLTVSTTALTTPVTIQLLICPSDPTKIGAAAGVGPLSYVVNGGCPNATSGTTLDWPANGAWSPGTTSGSYNTWEYIGRHDGTSTTISHSENLDASTYNTTTEVNNCILWSPSSSTTPTFNSPNPNSNSSPPLPRPSSNHPGGCVVTMCDGSVRFIQQTIAYNVYAALMTSNGAQASPPGTAYSGANAYSSFQSGVPLDTGSVPW